MQDRLERLGELESLIDQIYHGEEVEVEKIDKTDPLYRDLEQIKKRFKVGVLIDSKGKVVMFSPGCCAGEACEAKPPPKHK